VPSGHFGPSGSLGLIGSPGFPGFSGVTGTVSCSTRIVIVLAPLATSDGTFSPPSTNL